MIIGSSLRTARVTAVGIGTLHLCRGTRRASLSRDANRRSNPGQDPENQALSDAAPTVTEGDEPERPLESDPAQIQSALNAYLTARSTRTTST